MSKSKIIILCLGSFFLLNEGNAQDKEYNNAREMCIEEVSKYDEYLDSTDFCKDINSDNTWVSTKSYQNVQCNTFGNSISCKGTGTGTGKNLIIISLKNSGSISSSDTNTGTVIINTE